MRAIRAAAVLLATFGIGVAVATFQWPPYSWLRALWHSVVPEEEQGESAEDAEDSFPYIQQSVFEQSEALRMRQRLDALGYLDSYARAEDESGVTTHTTGAWPGLNLIVSGHEAGAALLDMEGRVLHRWSCPAESVWSDTDPESVPLQRFWRRVELLPDGRILALFDYNGIVMLDRDSRVVWQSRRAYHHEIRRTPEGTFVTLERRSREDPRIRATGPFYDDLVVEIDADGRMLQEISLTDALMASHLSPILRARAADDPDLLHTNAVRRLDGRGAARVPAFAAGNLLVSIRNLDTIAVIDPVEARVVWALAGLWRAQHDPVVLENGRLLVFDNTGLGSYSRVIEIDPVSQKIHWAYEGNADNGFFSDCCGTNQRLVNGNTLIVDTAHGRAIEVTPGNEIAWRWVSPHRKGDLVAALFEMVRLPPDGTPWLTGSAENPSGGQCAARPTDPPVPSG